MKLKSIRIVNFRQFFGEQYIQFATTSSSNVTIIHGENGSGKTAFLNAFKWAFYGTTDFEHGSDHLLSERAIAEADPSSILDMSVTVCFEHDGLEYEAVRAQSFRKSEEAVSLIGDGSFKLNWTDQDGAYHHSPNSGTHINQILPARMHPYFFFNGERIEKLSAIEGSKDIRNAIKAIMGLEILERAKLHLDSSILKKLRKELKESSTKELGEVVEMESKLNEEVDELAVELEQLEENKRHLRTQLDDVNQRISEIGPVATLQKEREALEKDIDECVIQARKLRQEKSDFISKQGFLAFSTEMLTNCVNLLNERRERGELPSKIKQQFITDLLESRKCICEREFEEDSDAWKALKSFQKQTVSTDVENAFIDVSSSVKAMLLNRADLVNRLKGFSERLHEIETSKTKKTGRLDEISSRIGSSKVENVESLESKREDIRAKISVCDQNIGRSREHLDEKRKELDSWVEKRKELEKLGDSEYLASRKLQLAEEASTVIQALNDSLSDRVRTELSSIVDDTFRGILKKDYWAEISEDYSLKIKKRVGDNVQEVVGKSTGESQVSSLAFIGGLLSLAKQRQKEQSSYYRGGVFPIVMDSPYGNLDPEYREKVAQAIPTLAEQVVIMVSNSQWKPEVESAVNGRVGREYTLMYYTPQKKSDTKTSSVIGGERYEYTEIKEGYYE
ncbi:MAG: AAA family ATPase [Pseudomonadales bacterium]